MKNPVFAKGHWLEYLMYGCLAAVFYCVLLFFHLSDGTYESMYLLYIGNAAFGIPVLLYNLKLIYRPYEKQRTVSMLIAAHLATLIGTILSMIFAALLMTAIMPEIFSSTPSVLGPESAPPNTQGQRPEGWLFMIVINALVLNFSVGSFICIVSSYAGKINQTKDKPAHLGKRISDGPVTNDA
ncbi:hypothetical protein [Chitinophaga rhizophila]|uniref:HPP family protein n=1 Tax=Chitinophaga rhizophila TaxID=2866212 RepID=A0ABS7GMJ2_9BACT|nr:hypothetical protein [Chitinophaga rhizophila]MBW8687868.1 hypothetical protein [Chitinophaga rhizophila]